MESKKIEIYQTANALNQRAYRRMLVEYKTFVQDVLDSVSLTEAQLNAAQAKRRVERRLKEMNNIE